MTIKKVDKKTAWYDNVCSNCQKEVNIVEGRYRCETCKRNIPYPNKRYDKHQQFRSTKIAFESIYVLLLLQTYNINYIG